MLTEVNNYIDNTSKLWRSKPGKRSKAYTDYLLDICPSVEMKSLITSGLIRMAIATDHDIYKQLATASFEKMENSVDNPLSLLPIKLPIEDGGRSRQISIEKAGTISREMKRQAKVVGLLHGHYRLLTPGNLANIVMAYEKCDVLLLGIERGSRSQKYKGVNPIFKDYERRGIMLSSALADYIIMISKLDYSNGGYRRMVQTIKPSVYFGNESDPLWLKQQMSNRAELAQAEYIELPSVKSFSSTNVVSGEFSIPNL
ncbi:MAG: hypothetical protein WAV40_01345 [Microgenomates group bacterium]